MSRLLERSFHWMLVSADEIHNPVQTKVTSDTVHGPMTLDLRRSGQQEESEAASP